MFAYLYSHQHNSSLTSHCQSNSFIMYSKTKCQRSMATTGNNKFWQKFSFQHTLKIVNHELTVNHLLLKQI